MMWAIRPSLCWRLRLYRFIIRMWHRSSGISAADSTAYFSYATSLVTIIVAILGPVLGSFADTKGYKKPVFTFFMMMGVLGCAGLAVPKTWLAFLAV